MRKTIVTAVFLWLFTCLLPTAIFAQNRTFSGTVITQDGTAIQGVTVSVKGTARATSTQADGKFSILAETGQVLVFSFVGYETKNVTLGNETSIKVVLNEGKGTQEDEVVVTGYGQNRSKRSLGYQATSVSGDELASTQRDNFLTSLAGRVPGLQITSTSGLPGASAQIMLRSGTSIGGNNAPLFIVDGMPITDGGVNQEDLAQSSSTALVNRNSDYANRIADLNPNDIESVTVLKGPEATAQYGSDGMSGAIVITTKKGRIGKPTITYSNGFSFSNVYRYPDIQTTYTRGLNGIYNPAAYANLYGLTSLGGYQFFGPKYDEGTVLYDNMKNFFQTGFSQRHYASLSGGNSGINYRLSAGYSNTGGVVPNTSYKVYNFSLKTDITLSKALKLTADIYYTNSDNDKAAKGAGTYYTNLMVYPQDIDAGNYINPNGTRVTLRGLTPADEVNSPFWDVNKNTQNDKADNLVTNFNFLATLAKNLTWTNILGLNITAQNGFINYHPYSREYYSVGGFLSTSERNVRNINGTSRFNYNLKWSSKLSSDINAGVYLENWKSTLNAQRGERFYETDFISINNTDPTARLATLAQSEVRKARFYGGVTFNYNNLLYLTGTATREGVSTFMSKFRNQQPFFSFGSLSGAFLLSDLNFMKATKSWLDIAKLRVSYATTGKGPTVPYIVDAAFRSVISTGGGFAYNVTGNNYNLRPELSKNTEIGAELKFLNNRLGIDVAWFQNNVKDNIYATRISYVSGTILKWVNGGTLQAKGWDIQLTGQPIKSENFNWNVTVNFDKSRSIVKSLPGDLPFYYDSDTWVFGNLRSQVAKDQSLATLSGYDFERNNKGQLLIEPGTGLPTQTIQTFKQIGDRQPDFKMGIINNISYKNFSLAFNLDIRKGGDVFNATEMMMTMFGVSKRTLDREEPRVIQGVLKDGYENTDNPTVNTIAITPYFRSGYYNASYAEADYVENVNWLRMRDFSISYMLGKKTIARMGGVIKSASVFVTGTDVFLITNYSGIDPNVNVLNSSNARGYGGAGIDYGSIPNPRTISFGVRLSL